MVEEWRNISGFENYYQVSNLGNVRRIGDYSNQITSWGLENPKILNVRKHSNGYLRVMLSVSGKHYDRYIHRLVATEFCNNPNPGKYAEVNHIDGNKTNNNAINLEWCDRSYNNKHAYIKGLHTTHGCYGNKKMVAQIDIKTNVIVKIYNSVKDASKSVGLKNFTNISACCNYAENPNKYKRPCLSSKGYKWRFATNEMKVGDTID
jgi:hypothetical protein